MKIVKGSLAGILFVFIILTSYPYRKFYPLNEKISTSITSSPFLDTTPSILADFPPNPIEKAGWTITVDDEFNGPKLNDSLWIPYYLRQRTPDNVARANYEFKNGCISLKIMSPGSKVSALQTLEKYNLHKPGYRKDFADKTLFVQKYGYFEIRAKTQVGAGHCSTFWLIGVQNDSTQSAEIDVLEQPGNLGRNAFLFNMYKWHDPNLIVPNDRRGWKGTYFANRDLTSTFNIYGLEWNDREIKFYFNNKLIRQIDAAPQYPMGVILSFYQGDSWWGRVDQTIPYPKEFQIDYFRAYKKNNK